MTIKQEKFINQRGFNPQQMKQARIAFENGLTIEQVETFYKPEYSPEQMARVRTTLEQKPASKPRTSSMNFFN